MSYLSASGVVKVAEMVNGGVFLCPFLMRLGFVR